jgi:sugar/nucleoside kinase (ribokinase family)
MVDVVAAVNDDLLARHGLLPMGSISMERSPSHGKEVFGDLGCGVVMQNDGVSNSREDAVEGDLTSRGGLPPSIGLVPGGSGLATARVLRWIWNSAQLRCRQGAQSQQSSSASAVEAEVAYFGVVGQDLYGNFLQNRLQEEGVIPLMPQSSNPDRATGRCAVLISQGGERTLMTTIGAWKDLGPNPAAYDALSTWLSGAAVEAQGKNDEILSAERSGAEPASSPPATTSTPLTAFYVTAFSLVANTNFVLELVRQLTSFAVDRIAGGSREMPDTSVQHARVWRRPLIIVNLSAPFIFSMFPEEIWRLLSSADVIFGNASEAGAALAALCPQDKTCNPDSAVGVSELAVSASLSERLCLELLKLRSGRGAATTAAAKSLSDRLVMDDCLACVITDGAVGASVCVAQWFGDAEDAGQIHLRSVRCPPLPSPGVIVDTSGAGDAFVAGCLSSLLPAYQSKIVCLEQDDSPNKALEGVAQPGVAQPGAEPLLRHLSAEEWEAAILQGHRAAGYIVQQSACTIPLEPFSLTG